MRTVALCLVLCAAPAIAEEPKPELSTDSTALFDAYGKNELAADKKYAGKYVRILIRVQNVQKDPESKKYFVGANVVYDPDTDYPPSVLCFLSPKHLDGADKLKRDQTPTLVGRVVGFKAVRGAWKGYVVVLEDCRLVPPEKK